MIIKVKKFNELALERYEKALQDYRDGKREHLPFKGMYVFTLPDNFTLRQRGFVATENNSHRFYLTREQVMQGENLPRFY